MHITIRLLVTWFSSVFVYFGSQIPTWSEGVKVLFPYEISLWFWCHEFAHFPCKNTRINVFCQSCSVSPLQDNFINSYKLEPWSLTKLIQFEKELWTRLGNQILARFSVNQHWCNGFNFCMLIQNSWSSVLRFCKLMEVTIGIWTY